MNKKIGLDKIRILYIEDNEDNQALMSRIIRDEDGMELIPADDGFSGIEMAQKLKPDLILMDINLPGINGVEVFKRLKKIDSTKDIPVWAFSANSLPSEISSVMALGFDEYIVKPVKIKPFLNKIWDLFS